MSGDFDISPTDEALIQALKSIIEIMVATQPIAQQQKLVEIFEATFHEQRDAMFRQGHKAGAAVFEQLRKFAADPARQKAREQAAELQRGPPAGRA